MSKALLSEAERCFQAVDSKGSHLIIHQNIGLLWGSVLKVFFRVSYLSIKLGGAWTNQSATSHVTWRRRESVNRWL